MEVTSNEANKLLKNLSEQIRELEVFTDSASTYVAATTENQEAARPDFDFKKVDTEIMKLGEKYRTIKHKLNVFNATTVLPESKVTIDEALVLMPELNARLYYYRKMKVRMPKRRLKSDYNIEYEYINYDLDDVNRAYDECNDRLIKLQTELDFINNSVKFEI